MNWTDEHLNKQVKELEDFAFMGGNTWLASRLRALFSLVKEMREDMKAIAKANEESEEAVEFWMDQTNQTERRVRELEEQVRQLHPDTPGFYGVDG